MDDATAPIPEETHAAALVAFALSVNTLRFLNKTRALDQEGVSAIVTGVLSALERSEQISEPVVHSARELLSGVAADLGVPMSTPH